jgi:Protein of unknown function (DUF3311)
MAESTPPRRNTGKLIAAGILLLIAIAGTLVVPIYARTTPKLGDFPFFYWYQLIWVPVVAILAAICYLLLRTKPTPGAGSAPASASDGRLAR